MTATLKASRHFQGVFPLRAEGGRCRCPSISSGICFPGQFWTLVPSESVGVCFLLQINYCEDSFGFTVDVWLTDWKGNVFCRVLPVKAGSRSPPESVWYIKNGLETASRCACCIRVIMAMFINYLLLASFVVTSWVFILSAFVVTAVSWVSPLWCSHKLLWRICTPSVCGNEAFSSSRLSCSWWGAWMKASPVN